MTDVFDRTYGYPRNGRFYDSREKRLIREFATKVRRSDIGQREAAAKLQVALSRIGRFRTWEALRWQIRYQVRYGLL